MAGLLTYGSQFPRTFPNAVAFSGQNRGHSPLTVAGAVMDSAHFGAASPYSLFIPVLAIGIPETIISKID